MRPDDAAVVGRENAGLKRTIKEEGIKCKTVAGEIAEIKLQTLYERLHRKERQHGAPYAGIHLTQ